MVKKPTLLLSPDGSFDANGRVHPSFAGGVLVVPGQHGNAWQVAEATTNLVPNPRFTNITSYWQATTGWSRVQDTAETFDGLPTLKSVGAGTHNHMLAPAPIPSLAVGDVLTVSFWFRSEAGAQYTVQVHDGNKYIEATTFVLSAGDTNWRKVEMTLPALDATVNLSGVRFYIYGGASSWSDTTWIAKPQVEKKAYATPYADGDMGAGHAWTGTPHASTSTRAAASVSVPNSYINSERGTVLIRFRDLGVGLYSGNRYLFGSGNYGVTDFISAIYPSRFPTAWMRNGPDAQKQLPAGAARLPGSDVQFGMTWDGENFTARVHDDVPKADVRVGPITGQAGVTLNIGQSGSGSQSSNVAIESVLTFDTALTDAEIADVMAMQSWHVLNPYTGNARIPYQSSVITFEREVFIADGNNNIIEDITPLVRSVSTDIDAARGDSKVEATIETYTDPIADGDWVAIYHTLTPERGDIIRRQRCLVRVETPRIQYTGGGEEIGISTGRDIIRDLAMATLDIPFYTPIGGRVMGDVEMAIRMLGITSMGPNLVTNGSFESEATGWLGVTFSNGATGLVTWVPYQSTPADGVKSFSPQMNANLPLGAKVWSSQVIPAGPGRYMASGLLRRQIPQHDVYMRFYARNAATTKIAEIMTDWSRLPIGAWERDVLILDAPSGTVDIVIAVEILMNVASYPYGSRSDIDDVQVRSCTGDLLPVSMLALPPSTAKATSRIQNGIGDHILEAVDVRLRAIGIHPPYTTPDGRPTSRPILASEQDSASRSYDIDDDRIADTVRIEASPSERANKVMAVKEVHDEPPLVATVYNRNPDDPYSLENYPPRGVRISMYDAVDVAALRAAALDELSRRVVRDEISFKIMPDPDINIHDVIEVTGPPEDRRVGRWIIIAIRDGSSGSDPAMEILARRVSLGEWS